MVFKIKLSNLSESTKLYFLNFFTVIPLVICPHPLKHARIVANKKHMRCPMTIQNIIAFAGCALVLLRACPTVGCPTLFQNW